MLQLHQGHIFYVQFSLHCMVMKRNVVPNGLFLYVIAYDELYG